MKEIFNVFWNMNSLVVIFLIGVLADYWDIPERMATLFKRCKNNYSRRK